MGLQSIDIYGFRSGLQKNNKKPFLFVDDAFQSLANAYCFRDEVKKREGLKLLGRYRRAFATASIGLSNVSPWNILNIYSTYIPTVIPEATAEIEPGSVVITIQAGPDIVFTDQGNGLLTSPTPGNSGYINYLNGDIVLTHTAGAGVASTASFAYFPTLPAMGIDQRELSSISEEQTVFFDTKYAYKVVGSDFEEFIPGTTWNGTDADFFWQCNYRGADAATRLLFVTNFVNDSGSPIRYTDGSSWNELQAVLTQTGGVDTRVFLTQAKLLVSYYGRLCAFNVWQTGATALGAPNYAVTQQFDNRCVYSQIGNPLETTVALPVVDKAWRYDEFGRGGFIDAPTNEAIIGAKFYKNTLIVFFEKSTWRFQYLGEYGLPFIWERISSDWGSESTFSSILFDNGVLTVGDKAITINTGTSSQRNDLQIPDQVYSFQNTNSGPSRVQGARDFKKEVVYWCYPEQESFELPGQYYPNKTLLYNYRNNTYAIYRNSITCLGYFQYQASITWDRTDVYWDNYNVTWDTTDQINMPLIVSGNQQGFAHFYNYNDVESQADSTIDANDQESLSVTGISASNVVNLTVKNHNLSSGEIIYLTGLNFVVTTSPATAGSTTLNDAIYSVVVIDIDTIQLRKWDQNLREYVQNFSFTNVGTYVGGGVIALFPKMDIETKDFNPAKIASGENIKTSFIDFLFDVSTPSPINVRMKMNTTFQATGNLLIGNKNANTANCKTGYVYNVNIDASPVIVITSPNHGLLDGDVISFSDIQGATQLNGNLYTITFLTTNTFSVSQAGVSTYTGGGYWIQEKQQYYTLSAQYSWHRFFSSCFGQFVTINLTYDDEQMNQISTHRQNFVLNAMKIWYRPGGRNIFGK